jgi:hypothetical protein
MGRETPLEKYNRLNRKWAMGTATRSEIMYCIGSKYYSRPKLK